MKNYVDHVKNPMSILGCTHVKERVARTTDLKFWAYESTDLLDGIYPTESLKRGLNFPLEHLSEDKFPNFPDLPAEWVSVSSDSAWAILDAFACVDDDETRYYMNGVGFDADGNVIGTDGRRMFVENTGLGPGFDGVILPYAPVLRRFIKPDRKRPGLEAGRHENHLWFRRGASGLGIKLIEGKFPEWKRVVPEEANYQENWFDLPDQKTLANALYLSGRHRRVYFREDGSIQTESMDEKTYTVGKVKANLKGPIAFAARFLADAVKAGGQRALVATDEHPSQKPIIVPLPAGGRHIIMPMQLE